MNHQLTPNHLTPGQLAAWRTRQLPQDSVRAVADHLAGCETCRRAAYPLGDGFRLLGSLAGDHLEYETLEALANGGTNGLDHIAVCPLCSSELADLRSFRELLQPSPTPRRTLQLWLPAFAAAALLIAFALWPRSPAARPQDKTPPVIASLHDAAGVVSLDQTGAVHGLPDLTVAQRDQIAQVLRTGELPAIPVNSDLVRSRETLLGDAAPVQKALKPLSPAGNTLLSDRPTFRWTAPARSTHFRVAVYNLNFEPVAESPDLSAASEWTPAKPLRRDAVYLWTVSALVGGQRVTAPQAPEPEVRFRILNAANAAGFSAIQSRQPASKLEIAIAAARLGLREEAENAIRDLTRDNPNSPLAGHLRQSLEKK